jgi:hypothetical protein
MVEFDILIDGYKSSSRYAALKAANYPVRGETHIPREPRSFVTSAERRGRRQTRGEHASTDHENHKLDAGTYYCREV